MGLTTEQALQKLMEYHVTDSIQVLRRWIRQGLIKAHRTENRKAGSVIDEESLMEFIASKRPEIRQFVDQIEQMRREIEMLKQKCAEQERELQELKQRQTASPPALPVTSEAEPEEKGITNHLPKIKDKNFTCETDPELDESAFWLIEKRTNERAVLYKKDEHTAETCEVCLKNAAIGRRLLPSGYLSMCGYCAIDDAIARNETLARDEKCFGLTAQHPITVTTRSARARVRHILIPGSVVSVCGRNAADSGKIQWKAGRLWGAAERKEMCSECLKHLAKTFH
jgi:hypothetical protein